MYVKISKNKQVYNELTLYGIMNFRTFYIVPTFGLK